MDAFRCICGQPLFFDNSQCLACGAVVAYDPARRTLGAVTDAGEGTRSMASDTVEPIARFRFCANRDEAALCNWLIPAESTDTLCLSCRLTHTIPDLSNPRNVQRFAALEAAKRHVLHGLASFGLPVVPRTEDPGHGLAFEFLETLPDAPPVMTGHANGLITLNVAEADAEYREMHRESLKEPYRTVIGHLRHELGHYYWDRLIGETEWLPRFRELFGDERADYSAALDRHYHEGPPTDWRDRYISAYASSHPWEDWAESFAHYMHLRSTLQTVASYGLDISHARYAVTPYRADVLYQADPADQGEAFLGWINAWLVLTAVLNETARSMGQPDLYPFVMNRAAVTKLHFVQCAIAQWHAQPIAAPPPELAVPDVIMIPEE